MRNQDIRDRFVALTALSQRVLPSRTATNKVATLLATRFKEPWDEIERQRKHILFIDHPLPADYEGENDDLPAALREARQVAVDTLMAESTPVRRVPDRLRLTADDMPKALKGENGEVNAEGLASIRVMLGSLYVLSDDERELDEQLDGTEE
jgi:hypothetical protein